MRTLLLCLLLLAGCGAQPASESEIEAARDLACGGQLDRAREALDALAEEHPADARVAVLAGEVATWRGDPEEGLDWLRRAAELAPDDPEPHLRAAYVLLVHAPEAVGAGPGPLEEAAAALAAAGGVETADYRACRGEAAWADGDEEEAERWFRGALDLTPDCRWALQRLLQIAAARGDEAEREDLNARLTAVLVAARRGEGMENARMPLSFCGH